MLVTDTETRLCVRIYYKYSLFGHVVKNKVAFFVCFRAVVVRVAECLLGRIFLEKFLGEFLRPTFFRGMIATVWKKRTSTYADV